MRHDYIPWRPILFLLVVLLPAAVLPLRAQQLGVLVNEGNQNWGLAVDRSGNVFVARSLQGTETLGQGQPTQTSLTTAGGVDLSIARYDPAGQLLWARGAGGAGDDLVEIIETDAAGNVYLAGTSRGPQNTTIVFGAGTPGEVSLTNQDNQAEEIFLASYDPDGNVRWARRLRSNGQDFVYDLDVSGDHLVVVGNVADDVSTYEGGAAPDGVIDVSSDHFASFVAVYTTAGDLVFVRGVDSDQRVTIRAGAIDAEGNVIAAGSSLRNVFVGGTEYTFGPTSRETFLAKWSATGDVVWVKHTATGASNNDVYRMATDLDGNILVTGALRSAVAFWSDSAAPVALTPRSTSDIFVAGFAPDGTPRWARTDGGPGPGYGFRIVADGGGDVVVSGIFEATATFGHGEATETSATSRGQADLFTAIYGADGSMKWFDHTSGSPTNDHPDGLEVTPSGDILVGTQFGTSTVLGNGETVARGFGSAALVLKYTGTSLVSREQEGALPEGFALGQNYPNPFNPSTAIRYALPATVAPGARVRLSVHDLLGREVAVLVDGPAAGGAQEVTWTAEGLPSGVYVYRLQSGAAQATRRMVLLK